MTCTVVYNFLQTAIVIESVYLLLHVGCELIKSIGMNWNELFGIGNSLAI